MKIGFIGDGRKTHYIVPRRMFWTLIGMKGLCGKRGKITLTDKPVTCKLCKRCNREIELIKPIPMGTNASATWIIPQIGGK